MNKILDAKVTNNSIVLKFGFCLCSIVFGWSGIGRGIALLWSSFDTSMDLLELVLLFWKHKQYAGTYHEYSRKNHIDSNDVLNKK